MVKKRVLLFIILEMVGVLGFYVTERNNNSDIYQVKEDAQRNILSIINPNSDKPMLREIIYYHIIEKPYGDFDIEENDKGTNKNIDSERDLAENKYYNSENDDKVDKNKHNTAENKHNVPESMNNMLESDDVTVKNDFMKSKHNVHKIDAENNIDGNEQTEKEYKTTDNLIKNKHNSNTHETDAENDVIISNNRTAKEYVTTDDKSFYNRVLKKLRNLNSTADGNLDNDVRSNVKEFDFAENNRRFTNGHGFQYLNDVKNETPIVNPTDLETNTTEGLILKNIPPTIIDKVNNKTAEIDNKTINIDNKTVKMDNNTIEIDNNTIKIDDKAVLIDNKTGKVDDKAITTDDKTIEIDNKASSNTLVNESIKMDKGKEDEIVVTEETSKRIKRSLNREGKTYGMSLTGNSGVIWNNFNNRKVSFAVGSTNNDVKDWKNKHEENTALRSAAIPDDDDDDKKTNKNIEEGNKLEESLSKVEKKTEEVDPNTETEIKEAPSEEEKKLEKESLEEENKLQKTASTEENKTENPLKELRFEETSTEISTLLTTEEPIIEVNSEEPIDMEPSHDLKSGKTYGMSLTGDRGLVWSDLNGLRVAYHVGDSTEQNKVSGVEEKSNVKKRNQDDEVIDAKVDKFKNDIEKLGATQPSTQKPKTEKPTTKKPKTQKPKTRKPKAKKPKTKKPKTKKPKTKKPKTKKPTTQKPMTEKPTTQKPTTQNPSTENPKTYGMSLNGDHGLVWNDFNGKRVSHHVGETQSEEPPNKHEIPAIDNPDSDKSHNTTLKPLDSDNKNDSNVNKPDDKNDKPNIPDNKNYTTPDVLVDKNDKPNQLDDKNGKSNRPDDKNDKPNTLDDKNSQPVTTNETNKHDNITDFDKIVTLIKAVFENETAKLEDKLNCGNSKNEDKPQNNSIVNEIARLIKEVFANETAKFEVKFKGCINSKDKNKDGNDKNGYNNTSQPIEDILKIVKNEEFWTWLNEWTTTYTELLMNRIDKRIKEEVSKQIKEYFAANNTVTESPTIDIRFGDTKDNTSQTDLEDPQTKRRKDRDENKNEKKSPVDIQATNIYGNSVGNSNVTNIFIFNIRNISDVENIKELSNGTNGVYIFGDDGKPIKNDTALIANKNETVVHTTPNPNEKSTTQNDKEVTTQITPTTPIEDNTVSETTETSQDVTTKTENTSETTTTETPKNLTIEKSSDTITESPEDVTTEKDNISDKTTKSPKDVTTEKNNIADKTTETPKDVTTEKEKIPDTTTVTPKETESSTQLPKNEDSTEKNKEMNTIETPKDVTTEKDNNPDTTTATPTEVTTESPDDVTTETENNSGTTTQTSEDFKTTETPEDVTTKSQDNVTTESQDDEAESQDGVTESPDYVTESQDDGTESQDDVTESKDDETESQDDVTPKT